jgi:hypothetical protein
MLASSPVHSSPGSVTNTPLNPAALTPNSNGPIFPHLSSHATNIKFLNKQDREAMLQYTKHFIRKAVQIIVQSRLGEKKPTKSRVYSYNTDWFNLSIKDLAQIATLVKTSLGSIENLFTTERQPFCVEISLRTPENQTMILETWCILFNDQLNDPSQKVCYNVYKKMSIVLRSLMCITRSIPTYQLSRRQNSDTYVLLYRLYCGEPIVHHLGENYATAKVGTVGTPVGSLIVNVAYRTRLTMTPQNSYTNEYTGGIQIKDDHFLTANTNNRSRYSPSSELSLNEKSPRNNLNFNHSNSNLDQNSYNSNSSLSKRSSSNLNTIAEVNNSPFNPNFNNRQSSKAQPIPMKSSMSQQLISNLTQNNSNNNANNTAGGGGGQSADECNSSSIASTPDTIYYFKLKSAAFVPSASLTSNNFYSSSFCNLNNNNFNASDADLPPAFINLLSNDFAQMQTSDRINARYNVNSNGVSGGSSEQVPHSPPPPNNTVELRNRQLRQGNQNQDDQAMISPCSLPNFKLLDQNMMQLMNHNQTAPDDFVFIESVSVLFLLLEAHFFKFYFKNLS